MVEFQCISLHESKNALGWIKKEDIPFISDCKFEINHNLDSSVNENFGQKKIVIGPI